MRKKFLSLALFPIIISSAYASSAESVVRTEVSGENATVHTEITNIVNDKEVKVESDQPGEIKVEVKDGEVKIETSPSITPTIIIENQENQEVQENQERFKIVEKIRIEIRSFLDNLFLRISRFFHFRV